MPTWERTAKTPCCLPIRGPDDAARVVLHALGTSACDRQAVLALGTDRRLVSFVAHETQETSGSIIVRSVLAIAQQTSAPTVVMATQRSGPPVCPTPADVDRFLDVQAACMHHGVLVVDWLILRQHHWWSLHELADAST